VLNKILIEKRKLVKEITVDMENNMQLAQERVFLKITLVTDRFHVVKLLVEALRNKGIKYRWEEIEKENLTIKKQRNKA
jgi:transposase